MDGTLLNSGVFGVSAITRAFEKLIGAGRLPGLACPPQPEAIRAQIGKPPDLVMDALSLSVKVWIDRADDDAGVPCSIDMQTNEVTSIQSEYRAIFIRRYFQHLGIRHFFAAAAALLDRHDVVSQRA